MLHQKKTLNFCDQFQLFQDINFKVIPITKKEKRQYHRYFEDESNQSIAEDIFQQMGNTIDEKEPLKLNINSNGNDNWKTFYAFRLNQLKPIRLDLNHNELTQLISEEWKKIKIKNIKKSDIIPIQKINRQKIAKGKNQQPKFSHQKKQLLQNENQSSNNKFLENIKETSFKIIINGKSYELLGDTLVKAIQNKTNEIFLQDNENESICFESSSDYYSHTFMTEKDDDNLVIENKLNSFL
ncbi:unnamed protein product [Paramecium sonneborni]|uniref:Uncharacterized protein n=1 Tax=Paramecium sonneborni TaxID=65129 RepID=A0A8S1N8W4_9CILI|nr:unnamed protein product [Paramecium sonneborni]